MADPPVSARDPVDVHVGERLRVRRKALGISQERLAGEIGLTFQQIQKYEKGANRISASRLLAAARALGWTPNDFFAGLEAIEAAGDDPRLAQAAAFAAAVREAALLVPEIARITRLTPAERKAVKALLLTMGGAP